MPFSFSNIIRILFYFLLTTMFVFAAGCGSAAKDTESPNSAPTVNLGPDIEVEFGSVANIILDSKGEDVNGDKITFVWELLNKPDTSKYIVPQISDSKLTFFPDKSGVYVFKVTASDGKLSNFDTITVSIGNATVEADAGSDFDVSKREQIFITGKGFDPEGEQLSYKWTQISGPVIFEGELNTQTLSVQAPEQVATLIFALIVNDGTADSFADYVQIDVLEDKNKAVFVSLDHGNDGNPGTKQDPLLSIQAAVDKAHTLDGGDVYIAAGNYTSSNVNLKTGISLYGGYEITSDASGLIWQRSLDKVETRIIGTDTVISGSSVQNLTIEGITVENNANGVFGNAVLLTDTNFLNFNQNTVLASGNVAHNTAVRISFVQDGEISLTNSKIVTNSSTMQGASNYGAHIGGNGSVQLHNNTIESKSASTGDIGEPGQDGADAPKFGEIDGPETGTVGACDSNAGGVGGASGKGARNGGKGGDGQYATTGLTGGTGVIATAGGAGGDVGSVGGNAGPGDPGLDGSEGAHGKSGIAAVNFIDGLFDITTGFTADPGTPGHGGGGGGGGGGQAAVTVVDGTGSGGGGGGGDGWPGQGGLGGIGGGISAGLVLEVTGTTSLSANLISAGNGGNGGNGGPGGSGGFGADGADGRLGCSSTIGFIKRKETGNGGKGGKGGNGGKGGIGGGGPGGPSIGVYIQGGLNLTIKDNTIISSSGGDGGLSGRQSSAGNGAVSYAVYSNGLPVIVEDVGNTLDFGTGGSGSNQQAASGNRNF